MGALLILWNQIKSSLINAIIVVCCLVLVLKRINWKVTRCFKVHYWITLIKIQHNYSHDIITTIIHLKLFFFKALDLMMILMNFCVYEIVSFSGLPAHNWKKYKMDSLRAPWYFVNNCLINVRILKSFCTLCDMHIICGYLPHTTLRFYTIDFQVNASFLSQFCGFKGVLQPDTKISMFCLFSPSSRRKSILFMYGCDRCVWFKVKKHDIFFRGSTNLSCGTVQNIFSFST